MTGFYRAAPCVLWALALIGSLPVSVSGQVSFSTEADRPESDEALLEAVLYRRGSIDFVEASLRDVVAELRKQFQIPIHLATKKLEEASISPDTPITKQLHNLPLDSILKLILNDLDLGYTIRDNVFLITTPEDLESRLTTRVYPVLDLITPRLPNARGNLPAIVTDYDSLIDLITNTLAPQSWDDVGGPGSIEAHDNSASLVVSQTLEVHHELENLLTTLRRVKSHQLSNSYTTPQISGSLATRPLTPVSRPYLPPALPK